MQLDLSAACWSAEYLSQHLIRTFPLLLNTLLDRANTKGGGTNDNPKSYVK